MDYKNLYISVIIPALNEEKNIISAINNTLKAFETLDIQGEIVVINDGSTDRTGEMVKGILPKDSRLRIITHHSPQGIGACFWEGVDNAKGNAIVLIPGDNENIPEEILRYYRLLEDVDIVIPFIFNREVRPMFRNMLSLIYRLIINSTFTVNFNYTNGTVLYRKSILTALDFRSNGFFFQTDILIRAVKKGYLFAEVPYRLWTRKEGVSKAVTFPTFLQIVKGYLRLVRDCYSNRNKKNETKFSDDSLTAVRRNYEFEDYK